MKLSQRVSELLSRQDCYRFSKRDNSVKKNVDGVISFVTITQRVLEWTQNHDQKMDRQTDKVITIGPPPTLSGRALKCCLQSQKDAKL